MGVSSVGNTSIAKAIAKQLGWPFEEGDDLHSEAEITTMHNGHPLDDHDCWPWLERVGGTGPCRCPARGRAHAARARRRESGCGGLQTGEGQPHPLRLADGGPDRFLAQVLFGLFEGLFGKVALFAKALEFFSQIAFCSAWDALESG